MPLLEENPLPRDLPLIVPVVIIGNGPSGISLSYLLSGYRPYLAAGAVHPNPILLSKLEEAKHLSIIDQDLEYLSEGLEGRSSNPVAVLFDSLLHPNADFGYEYPSVLQWRLEKQQHIPHLVLGKGTPGGAWHAMEGSMLTISLGIWMELPGFNYRDLAQGKRRNIINDRATPEEISSYYKNYIKLMGLQKNFVNNTYVTSILKLHRDQEEEIDNEGRGEAVESKPQLAEKEENGPTEFSQTTWEVRGYQRVQDGSHVPFCFCAENVVLATGASDSPARLDVEGEDLPFVSHCITDLGAAISKRSLSQSSDPLLIVGAGLSAADAVLCAYNNNISILHVFRKRVDDPSLIFKQLPKMLYPEYHKVYHMMCTQSPAAASILYPDYRSFPEHCVVSFQPDMKCVLQSASSFQVFKISMALVLIGTHPNLFFMKDQGKYLGLDPKKAISCKHNPLDIHPYTFECTKEANLFSMGPLIGDNFVRFLKGGALGITSCLVKRLKKKGKLIADGGGGGGIA
ncbi:oxidative stress-induced growth inhibitor 2-like isoform X1 [Acipenser oxyrinchus oxyrinchus]|uniref:Oxidative stress-induced growth inhibitor 2-like isoform X1 n=1 Tax=Acipenser oxyrinchus oxyrinchus TaxID=40147 RepID=A0AAD8GFA7_ACIOX|nr:oxidative stress-induced growth inhibitor 2-like isoform X1 [Acipenser oxyrinchus oxyrinchus]